MIKMKNNMQIDDNNNEITWREGRGIEWDWGSARIEKEFWRKGRAPDEAARLSNSLSSFNSTVSVDDDCPIFGSSLFQNLFQCSFFLFLLFSLFSTCWERLCQGATFASVWCHLTCIQHHDSFGLFLPSASHLPTYLVSRINSGRLGRFFILGPV